VASYLEAVDRWESTYGKYFRMPGAALPASPDMEAAQSEFDARRRELEPMLGRAHRLCLKYRLRNPFPGLLRITLGGHHGASAVSRGERNAAMECLVQLAEASSGWTPEIAESPEPKPERSSVRVSRRGATAAGILGVLAVMGIVIGRRRAERSPYRASGLAPAPPTRFYAMEGRPMTNWGGYGDILQHGMATRLEGPGRLLSLERTGPYIPPITFPGIGAVVLNSTGRKLLEASGLIGFGFQSVHKAHIVDLPWQDWDLTAREPRELPQSGKPEDYIRQRPANARVAEEMGDLWELVIPAEAKTGRTDIFHSDELLQPIVTERARVRLEECFAGYVQFEAIAVK
jgi:hypothetical protein